MSSPSLSSILSSLPRRLNDLESFQLPRLHKCLGPLDLHKELVDEMRGDLEGIRYNLELAKEMIYSLSPYEQNEAQQKIHELEQQYLSIKRSFRQAMLHSKRTILSRRSRVHELNEKSKSRYELDESRLVEGDEKGKGKARSAAEFGMGGDDELQTKTNEVTVALRRTTELMQTELEKSVLSIQTLGKSEHSLHNYTQVTHPISYLPNCANPNTKQNHPPKHSSPHPTYTTATPPSWTSPVTLAFFFLVVGFILKRRILDKTVGVVIGGVGRGVGWYLFGTGRLIKFAFRGKAKEVVDVEKMGSDEVDRLLDDRITDDSAVGGIILDEDVPSPREGAIPTQPFDISKALKDGKGGKVETIPNDEGKRLEPNWVKDEL
uniref:Uncharacterized protein n=1 Tax=Kwoniella bestiolae CBS 10118 TaxID=1296100 RepID=A0A1B9FXN1_9TREE|nr:hypothetical protein I302_06512 [Kwoniella bestiolae CBS 10118]OCF23529.1 hypothetical protein I302_06512 [Kwoniella bestiolae CBS 10118]